MHVCINFIHMCVICIFCTGSQNYFVPVATMATQCSFMMYPAICRDNVLNYKLGMS